MHPMQQNARRDDSRYRNNVTQLIDGQRILAPQCGTPTGPSTELSPPAQVTSTEDGRAAGG